MQHPASVVLNVVAWFTTNFATWDATTQTELTAGKHNASPMKIKIALNPIIGGQEWCQQTQRRKTDVVGAAPRAGIHLLVHTVLCTRVN